MQENINLSLNLGVELVKTSIIKANKVISVPTNESPKYMKVIEDSREIILKISRFKDLILSIKDDPSFFNNLLNSKSYKTFQEKFFKEFTSNKMDGIDFRTTVGKNITKAFNIWMIVQAACDTDLGKYVWDNRYAIHDLNNQLNKDNSKEIENIKKSFKAVFNDSDKRTEVLDKLMSEIKSGQAAKEIFEGPKLILDSIEQAIINVIKNQLHIDLAEKVLKSLISSISSKL